MTTTMYVFCAAIWGAIAYYLYPTGVFSIPLAQLTLGKVFCLIGSILSGIGTIASLFYAFIEQDKKNKMIRIEDK